MKKKLSSTKKEPFEIIESNGGTKLVLNTGTYELLKFASKKYFQTIHVSLSTYVNQQMTEIK